MDLPSMKKTLQVVTFVELLGKKGPLIISKKQINQAHNL